MDDEVLILGSAQCPPLEKASLGQPGVSEEWGRACVWEVDPYDDGI